MYGEGWYSSKAPFMSYRPTTLSVIGLPSALPYHERFPVKLLNAHNVYTVCIFYREGCLHMIR